LEQNIRNIQSKLNTKDKQFVSQKKLMEKQLEVIRAADERERLLTTQVVIFFFTIHIFHFFSANFGKSGYS
jgi:hypothetical protein